MLNKDALKRALTTSRNNWKAIAFILWMCWATLKIVDTDSTANYAAGKAWDANNDIGYIQQELEDVKHSLETIQKRPL
jgi:hypothetical protein